MENVVLVKDYINLRYKDLIADGESRKVEFKSYGKSLGKNLYETVCAFLNRDGGDVILGIKDDGEVRGIDENCIDQLKRNFVNMINNPEIINPPCYLSIVEVEHENKKLLHIIVPQSSQVHRCKNRIYDRNEDGDFDITDNQGLVANLYMNKQKHYSENTIYPYAQMSDLRADLIDRARKLATIRQPGHLWSELNDKELLESAQLWKHDFHENKQGLTLAGILLFGKDTTILSVLPHHRTDAILRKVDTERYDDRDDIRTNLLESYDRLIAFGKKHLDDPFYLEGNQRISLRSIILREIVGNLLIHREYSHAFPAKLVIEENQLFSENSNQPQIYGDINPARFFPVPKNPLIARVFKEIGWADELGSGVRKLFRYCKEYSGNDPEISEENLFRLTIKLHEHLHKTSVETSVETPPKTSVETPESKIENNTENTAKKDNSTESNCKKPSVETSVETPSKTAEKIIKEIMKNPAVTIANLALLFDVSQRSIERNISTLQNNGRLKRIGPNKGGKWEVIL